MDPVTQAADSPRPSPFAVLRAHAYGIRKNGRALLNGRGTALSHRLLLLLALMIWLTVTVGLLLLADGIYSLGYALAGDLLWLDLLTDGIFYLSCLLLSLPLGVSVWRLTCLMAVPPTLPTQDTPPPASLTQLFYPFRSLRAYGRCLAVGLEAAAWGAMILPVPLLLGRIAREALSHLSRTAGLGTLCRVLSVLCPILLSLLGLAALLLSGRRCGYGCYVFWMESCSLSEVNRCFGGFRRGILKPLFWRLSLAGWFAVSLAAVLVPFVIHTIPYYLCCSTSYARGLERK